MAGRAARCSSAGQYSRLRQPFLLRQLFRELKGQFLCFFRRIPGPVSYTHLDVYKRQALEYMRQKSLTDDSPEDIAREYRMVEQKIKAALDSLNGVTL